ncbi:MAG: SCP2 sterol-binding domain-containing protein [Anaerolineae bacterium]|jgi:putative sterol carrier protein
MPEYTDVGEALRAMTESVGADKLKGMDATILFDVSGAQGGRWTITIQDGQAHIEEGSTGSATLTVQAASKDLLAMFKGQLNPMAAFMRGRLKVKGDMSMAMQLQKLFG